MDGENTNGGQKATRGGMQEQQQDGTETQGQQSVMIASTNRHDVRPSSGRLSTEAASHVKKGKSSARQRGTQ